jgi:hypothetical protein
MKLSKRVLALIEEKKQADFINPNQNENSMLNRGIKDEYLMLYENQLKVHYHDLLMDKFHGSFDEVLDHLESYIILKINELSKTEQDTISAGKLASEDGAFRTEFTGEIGRYHTALRALKDEATVTWPSLLHKGSTRTINDIPARELLAYYWLAASDEAMEFCDVFKDEVKNEGIRNRFIEASKENFVAVLAEIRRAHNVKELLDTAIDDPSCSPGTLGRIVTRASIYNRISTIPPTVYEKVAERILDYIVYRLKTANMKIQSSVYNHLNNTFIGEPVDKLDEQHTLEFIKSLGKGEKLKRYLLSAQDFLDKETYHELRPIIREIFKIEKENLTLKGSALIEADFACLLLRTTVNSVKFKKLNQVIPQEIISFRIETLRVVHEIITISRLVDNELIRALLCSHYGHSRQFMAKAIFFQQLIDKSRFHFDQLMLEFKRVSELEADKIETEVRQDSIIPEGEVIRFEKETSKALPDSTQKRLIETQQEIQRTKKIVDAIIALQLIDELNKRSSLEELANLLAGCNSTEHVNYTKGSAFEWAYNLNRLWQEREADNKRISDEKEMGRNLSLIKQHLSESAQKEVAYKLGEMISVKDRNERRLLLILAQLLDCNTNRAHFSSIKLEEAAKQGATLFPANELQQTLALSQLSITYPNLENEEYLAWKRHLHFLSMDETLSDTGVAHTKLKMFVLFTFFNNLEITQLRQQDAVTLNWLCGLYLGEAVENADQPLPFDLKELTLPEHFSSRVDKLAGHICCLLTSLKRINVLVNAEAICLMTSVEATRLLQSYTGSTSAPFIFRLSNRAPNSVAISCYLPDTKEKYQHLLVIQAKQEEETFTASIEGQTFTFMADPKPLIQKICAAYRLNQIMFSSLSLPEIFSETYRRETKFSYIKAGETINREYIKVQQHSTMKSTLNIEKRLYLGPMNKQANNKEKEADTAPTNDLGDIYSIHTAKEENRDSALSAKLSIIESELTKQPDLNCKIAYLCKILSELQNTYLLEKNSLNRQSACFFQPTGADKFVLIHEYQAVYLNVLKRLLNLPLEPEQLEQIKNQIYQPEDNIIDFASTNNFEIAPRIIVEELIRTKCTGESYKN